MLQALGFIFGAAGLAYLIWIVLRHGAAECDREREESDPARGLDGGRVSNPQWLERARLRSSEGEDN